MQVTLFTPVHTHPLAQQIVALANLLPVEEEVEELDSYMYQTVGHGAVACYAAAAGLPLYRRAILGGSKRTELVYPGRSTGASGVTCVSHCAIGLLCAMLKHVVRCVRCRVHSSSSVIPQPVQCS